MNGIDGMIYDVSPRNDRHRNAVNVLGTILTRALSEKYTIQVQDAVAIPNWEGASAPEPDVAVIARGYIRGMPTARQTFAIVEVSDTTYARDRKKVELYVAAGVPSHIVNIEKQGVERHETAGDLRGNGPVFEMGTAFTVLGVMVNVAELEPE